MSIGRWLRRRRWDLALAAIVVLALVGADTAVSHVRQSPAAAVTGGAAATPGPVVTGSAPVAVGAPGPPRAVTAVAHAGRITVHWAPPASEGGSPITGYTVVYTDTTRPTSGLADHVGGSARSFTAKLATGDSWVVTVLAVNAHGTGPASAGVVPGGGTLRSQTIVVAARPTAPRTRLSGSVATVSWSVPAPVRPVDITGYQLTLTDWTAEKNRVVVTGTGQTAALNGLVKGHDYTVSAVTVTSSGISGASLPSAVIAVPPEFAVTRTALSQVVPIGVTGTVSVPFSLRLSRPGALTLSVVQGSRVAARTTVTARSTTVSGRLSVHLSGVGQLGTYTYVVTGARSGRVLARVPLALKQNSLLSFRTSRRGQTITVHAMARWASLQQHRLVPWAGRPILVERLAGHGWVTIGMAPTDASGHLTYVFRYPGHIRLRLVDLGTGAIVGTVTDMQVD